MKPIKLQIKDLPWSFEVLEDNEYEYKHGKDSHGITDKELLLVHFKKSSLTEQLVKHEMFHVYYGSCCINSTGEIIPEDVEEIAAEIIERHGEELIKNSKKVYNTLTIFKDHHE